MDETANKAGASKARQGLFSLAAAVAAATVAAMLIAWTTVTERADAEKLARGAAERRLAACVQIDGPIVSHYFWQGRPERAEEFRLCFKFLPEQQAALETWLFAQHPYDTPEWFVVQAERVGEKYLSWARSNATSSSL